MLPDSFKGLWIPKEIWYNPCLSLQEKVLLAEVNSLDQQKGCYANNRHFAELLGLSCRRVQSILNSLKHKGYLQTSYHYRPGTKEIENRVIQVLSPNHEQVVKDIAQGGE